MFVETRLSCQHMDKRYVIFPRYNFVTLSIFIVMSDRYWQSGPNTSTDNASRISGQRGRSVSCSRRYVTYVPGWSLLWFTTPKPDFLFQNVSRSFCSSAHAGYSSISKTRPERSDKREGRSVGGKVVRNAAKSGEALRGETARAAERATKRTEHAPWDAKRGPR